MLRIFGEKKNDALSQFINEIWKEANNLAGERDELSNQSIKILSKSLIQHAPWLISLYENASFDLRKKIITYLAKQFFLAKVECRGERGVLVDWVIKRQADKVSFFHQVLTDPEFKRYLCNLTMAQPVSVASPVPPAEEKAAPSLTPVARLKADIIAEVNEQKKRMLIETLIKNDRPYLVKHVGTFKWVKQSVFNTNLEECLPDEVLEAILQYDIARQNEKSTRLKLSDLENQPIMPFEAINVKNEKISANNKPVAVAQVETLEEEFETAVVEGLVEAIQKSSDTKDSNKQGIIIYSSLDKASLPGTLFGSKENLSKALEPVLTMYKEKARLN